MSKTPSLEDIMTKLHEITNISVSSASKLDSYIAKTDELSVNVTAIASTVNTYDVRIAELEAKINKLEGAKTHDTVRMDDESVKQEALRRNVCIFGIPHTVNENLGTILSALSSAIGCSIDPLDIADKYRVKATAPVGLIVIRFNNFKKKLEFLASAKRKGRLSVSSLNLNLSSSESIIYINNHLTPYFAKIFRMGRQAVMDKKIDSCWFAMNCVCIVKSPGEEKILVKSLRAMEQLFDTPQNMGVVGRPQSSGPSAPLDMQTAATLNEIAITSPSHQSTSVPAPNRKRKASKIQPNPKAIPKRVKQDKNKENRETTNIDQPIN